MKATDKMKLYLNSIIGKIDRDIHNELWDHLRAIIVEQHKAPEQEKPEQGQP